MTDQEIKEEITRLVKESAPPTEKDTCRVIVMPFQNHKMVFISFTDGSTWRKLFQADSYQDLLEKVKNQSS